VLGGFVGGGIEVGVEQPLRAALGVELMSTTEIGFKVGLSVIVPAVGERLGAFGSALLRQIGKSKVGGAADRTIAEMLGDIFRGKRSELTVEEGIEIVKGLGYEVPDDIKFVVGDPGRGKAASYSYNFEDSPITWESFFNEKGKVPVTLLRKLLKEPLNLARKIAHELHELQGLRETLNKPGVGMTREQIQQRIDVLHQQALLVEKEVIRRWREMLSSLTTK
jgi:hypothetical protein